MTISAGQVTAGQVTHPDTSPPPITVTAPARRRRLSGTVPLSASHGRRRRRRRVPARRRPDRHLDHSRPVLARRGTRPPRSTARTGCPRARPTPRAASTPRAVVPVTVAQRRRRLRRPAGLSRSTGRRAGRSRRRTSPSLDATQSGDLLLAFVAADGPAARPVGHRLGRWPAWTLVRRVNTRVGTRRSGRRRLRRRLTGATRHRRRRRAPATTSRSPSSRSRAPAASVRRRGRRGTGAPKWR